MFINVKKRKILGTAPNVINLSMLTFVKKYKFAYIADLYFFSAFSSYTLSKRLIISEEVLKMMMWDDFYEFIEEAPTIF